MASASDCRACLCFKFSSGRIRNATSNERLGGVFVVVVDVAEIAPLDEFLDEQLLFAVFVLDDSLSVVGMALVLAAATKDVGESMMEPMCGDDSFKSARDC